MVGKTHIAGALALTSAVSLICVKTNLIQGTDQIILQQATLLTASGIGGLLPDIDHKGSTISRSNPVISFFVRLFFTHRGFTHSLLSLALIAGLAYFIASIVGSGIGFWIAIGFGIGYASHILLDSFNPKGVPLFYPIRHKFSFAGIVTGGWAEKLVFIICIVITVLCEMTLLGIRLSF